MFKESETKNNRIERNNSHEPILNDSTIIEILNAQENKITQISNSLLEELQKTPNINIVSCCQLSQLGLEITSENLNAARSILSEIANKNLLEEKKQLLFKKLLEKISEIKDKTDTYNNLIAIKLYNTNCLDKKHLLPGSLKWDSNRNTPNLTKCNELSDSSIWNKNNLKLLIVSINRTLEATIRLIDTIKNTLEKVILYAKEKLNKLINPNNYYSAISRIIISNELLKKHYKKIISKDLYIKPDIQCLLC